MSASEDKRATKARASLGARLEARGASPDEAERILTLRHDQPQYLEFDIELLRKGMQPSTLLGLIEQDIYTDDINHHYPERVTDTELDAAMALGIPRWLISAALQHELPLTTVVDYTTLIAPQPLEHADIRHLNQGIDPHDLAWLKTTQLGTANLGQHSRDEMLPITTLADELERHLALLLVGQPPITPVHAAAAIAKLACQQPGADILTTLLAEGWNLTEAIDSARILSAEPPAPETHVENTGTTETARRTINVTAHGTAPTTSTPQVEH